MALDVSSVPLSLTIVAGLARQPMIASSARDASPADRGVGHQRQTLAGAVVVHLQDPEPAPVGELVGDEVETPALVGDRGCLYRPPRSHGPLAPAALANHQPLLAIQTLNALFVDRMALAPQQHMQPPIAEPPPLLGQGLQPLAKFAVIRPPGLAAHAGPIAVDHPARPPLAHLIGLLQISRSLPMRGGRHHFFRAGLSTRRCRAWRPPASASAWRSHPPTPSAGAPPTRPGRHTWPSTCRRSAS